MRQWADLWSAVARCRRIGEDVVKRARVSRLLCLLVMCPACAPDPAVSLVAGQCREDSDCPGRLMCLNEKRPGEIATCGCKSDAMCPLDLACDWGIDPATDWNDAWGNWLGNCRCRTQSDGYPENDDPTSSDCGFLGCSSETWLCRCTTDLQCQHAHAGAGCRCDQEAGLCVRNRGDDVVLCDLDRPVRLTVGQCRRDEDCPGEMVCAKEEGQILIGRCVCQAELPCPFSPSCYWPWDETCACLKHPEECGPLSCNPATVGEGEIGRCSCDNDQQCEAADPGLGCRCESGYCVRDRGDDVLLCDLRLPGADPDPPDAGVSDGGQPADPADSGAGGEQ